MKRRRCSAGKTAIVLRALQTIELQLSNPDRSPGRVARCTGISLRYLQQLFEATGESPNHTIRRRRLERCFQDLKDPLQAGQAIAEIGFRWGFTDAGHFSRLFKERYGISPSVHRGPAVRTRSQPWWRSPQEIPAGPFRP